MKFNITFYCVMILAIILLSGCSEEKKKAEVIPSSTVTITIETEDDAASVGAYFYLTSKNPNANQANHGEFTWGQKEFVWEDVKYGSYTLTASHPDFIYYLEDINVDSEAVSHKISLKKNKEAEVGSVIVDLKIRFNDGGSLTGATLILANDNRNPLSGVFADTLRVPALENNAAQRTASVTFPNMVRGYYTLTVLHQTYSTLEVRNILLDKSEVKLIDTFPADEREHALSLVTLVGRTRFVLTVRSSDSRPLKGTEVVLRNRNIASLHFPINLDDLGSLNPNHENYFDSSTESTWSRTFYDLLYGRYELTIKNKDFIYIVNPYDINVSFINRNLTMTVTPPDSSATVRFPIVRRFEDGNEFTGAIVTMKNNNGNPNHVFTHQVTSADTNSHQFTNIPFGGYEFTLTFPSGFYRDLNQSNLIVNSSRIRRPTNIETTSPNGTFELSIRTFLETGSIDNVGQNKDVSLIPQNIPNLPPYTATLATSVHQRRFNNVIWGQYKLEVEIPGTSGFEKYESEVFEINDTLNSYTAYMVLRRDVTINIRTATDFEDLEVTFNLKEPHTSWSDHSSTKSVTSAGNNAEGNRVSLTGVPRNLYVLTIKHEDIEDFVREIQVNANPTVVNTDTLRVKSNTRR